MIGRVRSTMGKAHDTQLCGGDHLPSIWMVAQVTFGEFGQGDSLGHRIAEGESVRTCITSPPYWGLRDYGEDGQLGLEETPQAYVQNLVEVFGEVRRVLTEDGTLWLNLGDSYAGGGGAAGKPVDYDDLHDDSNYPSQSPMRKAKSVGLKQKDLVGIPWRVALALQDDGWWLRSDIIWHKPNPMPESVTDRPTSSHEHIFLLAKSKQYYYDADGDPAGCSEQRRSGWADNHHHDPRDRHAANWR